MRTKVFHSYPRWQMSGVNTWSMNLAKSMAGDQDFEHVMLITGLPPSAVTELDEARVPYVHLDLPPVRQRCEEWVALRRFLDAHEPCIYIPNYDFHRSCAAPTFSKHVRICAVVHSDEHCYYDELRRLGESFDAIVAVSSHIEESVRQRFPSLGSRVTRILHGVPLAPGTHVSGMGNGPLHLAFCNRLSQYQKRVFDLPEVLYELNRREVDFRLNIAGEGPDERELVRRLESAGIVGKVRMTGRLSPGEVQDVLLSSDVFLLTSDFEGLPISLLESLAAGCVPVVYDIQSGVREVIEQGVNGILVPHAHTSKMADALEELARDRGRLAGLSRACIESHAAKFSLSRMSADYKLLFEELMESSNQAVVRRGRIPRPPDLTFTHRFLRRIGLRH
jgi:glycosyltransferase involved in cell wall biosynthesis